jgi:hypothetical protein
MGAGKVHLGGPTIDTWTVHCPECGADVAVEDGAAAVPCPRCDRVLWDVVMSYVESEYALSFVV